MPHPPDQPRRFPSDRSERAKAMAAAGLFGGAGRGQGRKPKNRTASEQVAELAANEAPAIKRAFSGGLRSRNERTRLLAAKELLAEERRELERKDAEAFYRAMPPAQLEAALMSMLGDALGIDLAAFQDDSEIVDADVVSEPVDDTAIKRVFAELGAPIEETETIEVAETPDYDPMDATLGGDLLQESAQEIPSDEDEDGDAWNPWASTRRSSAFSRLGS